MVLKRTDNVTPLRRPHLVLPLDQLDGIRAVQLLSIEIHHWQKVNPKLHTLKRLADKAQLGRQTVSRIWYRHTVQPRLTTCIRLFSALGFSAVKFERD